MNHNLKVFVLLSAMTFSIPQSYSQVLVSAALSIRVAPPMLRVYSQPECPIDGYLWSPGYWAYDSGGYYWVAGEWVLPPSEGLLWTPGYWSFSGGYYGWQTGYWGSVVGFYGGVNYGYGYSGHGYNGGMWQGGHFRYNTAVANVNRYVIHNTYVNHAGSGNSGRSNNRRSFNGPGGITARPSGEQQTAREGQHMPPTSKQSSHVRGEGNVSQSHTSPNEKTHASMPKNPASESHRGQNAVSNHTVRNTPSKPANERANTHLAASRQKSETVRTPRTMRTNTHTVTQSRTAAPRTPHVQEQHTMHTSAGRQEGGGGGGKKGGDKRN